VLGFAETTCSTHSPPTPQKHSRWRMPEHRASQEAQGPGLQGIHSPGRLRRCAAPPREFRDIRSPLEGDWEAAARE
jgi:hypothetical protein